jgi:iron complex outermembrane receptor protein
MAVKKQKVYDKTDIAFSPAVTGAAELDFVPVKKIQFALISKYVSRQYLDNTSNKSRSLDAFFVQDVRVIYTINTKVLREINLVSGKSTMFSTNSTSRTDILSAISKAGT